MELTTAEKETLRLYREHLDRHGAPPSLRGLAAALGVEHSAVRYTLKRLHLKGYMQEKKITEVRLALRLSAKGKNTPL